MYAVQLASGWARKSCESKSSKSGSDKNSETGSITVNRNTKQILEDLDKHASEFSFPVLDNAHVEFAAARLTAFQGVQDLGTGDRRGNRGQTGRSQTETAAAFNPSHYSVCWLTFSSTPMLASITNTLDPP